MKKKWKVLIITLSAIVALTMVFGGVALADEGEDYECNPGLCQPQALGVRRGLMMGPAVHSGVLSDLLGMSLDEISEQRQDGKSLVEIAAEQGVDEETLVATLVGVVEENLQQRVDDGFITQERADLLLELVTERVTDAVNRTEVGPSGSGRHLGGRIGGRIGGRGGCGGDWTARNGGGFQRYGNFS